MRHRRISQASSACLALVTASAASLATGGGATAATGRAQTRYTLTVRGVPIAGQAGKGAVAIVQNVSASGGDDGGIVPLSHGVATFTVPAGPYYAQVDFTDYAGGHRSADKIVQLPQFTVTGNQTVTLTEKSADSLVRFVTPRPAVADATNLLLLRSGAGSNGGTGLVLIDNVPVWISPVRQRPSTGMLSMFSAQTLTSPAGTKDPYEYNVAAAQSGLIRTGRQVITAASLATMRSRFYQDVPSTGTGYSVPNPVGFAGGAVTPGRLASARHTVVSRFGAVPGQLRPQDGPPAGGFPPSFYSLTYPLRLPGVLTQYYSAGPSLDWTTGYWQAYTFEGPPANSLISGGQNAADQVFRPGEQLSVNWNAYPLHPVPNTRLLGGQDPAATQASLTRAGNLLRIGIAPFGDNQAGHTGAGFAGDDRAKVSGSYVLDQNGVKIAGGNAVEPGQNLPPFLAQATLTSKPSVLRLSLTASRNGSAYQLSTRTTTVWTWRSAPPATGTKLPAGWSCSFVRAGRVCAVQPLLTLDYQVHGQALNGTTAAGAQVLGLTVGHIEPWSGSGAAISGVSVSVSYDSGHGWHAAVVRAAGAGAYRVTYSAPAGSCVSLRVHAADAAGGQISETISCGYKTAGRS
jgi:hypothetical protein